MDSHSRQLIKDSKELILRSKGVNRTVSAKPCGSSKTSNSAAKSTASFLLEIVLANSPPSITMSVPNTLSCGSHWQNLGYLGNDR